MKSGTPAIVAILLAASATAAPRTLRVDYFHTGGPSGEVFSLDRVVVEPLPWPGNLEKSIDDTNLGPYFFEVSDAASKRVVYSRGFASVYGEWVETDEAKNANRTFSESLRFPTPDSPVHVVIERRDARNVFREVWNVDIDPHGMFVETSAPPAPAPLLTIQKNGEPAQKVDFLILGDGYTKEQAPKFEMDARRLTEILFSTAPFKEHRADFNVWALCPPAAEPGISRPSTGVHRRNPIGATYDAFGSERYILSFDNRAFREAAQFAPYEFVEILVNGQTYGGGGIFNLYSTVAADSLWAPYIFVHEFGHHIAGLADEYYTSDVAYDTSGKLIEPWEPNATAETDPARLKWRDLLTPGIAIPTPWKKEEFEKESLRIQTIRRKIRADKKPESEMDALFQKEKEAETMLLGADTFSGKVGLFEGANYQARGYYRSQEDCIMFTRDTDAGFCAACRRAIERVIALYTGK